MPYMHDVWLNWSEGAEYESDIPHFFEWKKDDGILLYDQLLAFKVEKEFFDYLVDNILPLPEGFVESVRDKAYYKTNSQKYRTTAFIVYDNERVVAVECNDEMYPIRKSRLIPRQDRLVEEILEFSEPIQVEFPEVEDLLRDEIKVTTIGLTRTEKEKKQALMTILHEAIYLKSDTQLKYWYSEFNYSGRTNIEGLDSEEMAHLILNEVKLGWGQNHEDLLRVMLLDKDNNMKYGGLLTKVEKR